MAIPIFTFIADCCVYDCALEVFGLYCFMAASFCPSPPDFPSTLLEQGTETVWIMTHNVVSLCLLFELSKFPNLVTHQGLGYRFRDLADDPRVISTAWALAAHEPWCAVHYLFTAHSYTRPWDSGLQLGASELFGQAGLCAWLRYSTWRWIEIFKAHSVPLYNKHLIINCNHIISIFVSRLNSN